ncbi:MAG: F0F1 ATP synthase subunit A [Dehalococcoidales bacterium]|nr:F0F1 ATP synthase subunit A [Dehalococcoidales bacterium]
MAKRRILGMPRPLLAGVLFFIVFLFVVGFLVGPMGRKIFGDLGLPAWLSLPHPEFQLPAETAFHLFGFPVANSIIGAWITMAVLICVSYIVTRRMRIVPGRLQSAFEFLLGWLNDLCRRVAGEENGRRFFPIVATIFLFIAFNAWLSLIPGFGSIFITNAEGEHVHLLRGANTDINMPLALALVSFVFVEYFGLKSLGLRYLGKFFNAGQFFQSIGHMVSGRLRAGLGGLFTGFIHIFVGLLEALSEMVRIVSFTFRLFGNMTAGEILLLIAAFLIPWVFALPFYGLELLVGFVQALIFAGLTLVFLTMAVAHHGDEPA